MKERLNITLDKKLEKILLEICPEFKENKSKLIEKALRAYCDARIKEKIDELLAESYKRTYKEDLIIVKEFETVDLEDWDEY
ncbi:MAG: hypothetical protein A2Y62_02595 [Candidatus Fischerbacteria bacterium RBG_13_37_8]|uniref:Ribbon-helix-helix protein CopG domain-containing protein n=1 Tax=Candidatus Fischerbacteria bacterium RBG_13_37_8 TaxID=1817863 RepID=A0A1F5V5C5_9BACT|nr:MAG: hypothetical protein A2Y62_02595 [Candidatus Fischerbacteria bacterium RBG_13_37_8]